MKKQDFQFTPDNLIANLHRLGPWSAYGLASEALRHYFPDEYADGEPAVSREADLAESLGCNTWQSVITKYHADVGYKGEFNPKAVNEY